MTVNQILVTFQNHPALVIDIQSTNLGLRFIDLIKQNCQTYGLPSYRDRIKYTEQYMHTLAIRAQEAFGWQWDIPTYDLQSSIWLHKDLERLLGATDFSQVPQEYDELLMELHYCLHIVQDPGKVSTRQGAFQLEWFNDSGFDLDRDFEFGTVKRFGDVEFLNPWVGHSPTQIFFENDYINIPMTCKFHDRVKPGIVISTYEQKIDRLQVLDYFSTHAPEFVKLHSKEKIMHYTGYPCIGRVSNLDTFRQILTDPNEIKVNKLEFV
jgi:hypothetical protein